MQTLNPFFPLQKFFHVIMLLAVFLSALGLGGLSPAMARAADSPAAGNIISDGQFVYGPNIGSFDLKKYLEDSAPHLLKYADDLYGRAEYYSINPKIYLTFFEIRSQLISNPDTNYLEDPFGLPGKDLLSQIDTVSVKMEAAYYLHLYTYSQLLPSERKLPAIITTEGLSINLAPQTNAGTYAVIAGLAAIQPTDIALMLDNTQPDGFYQTYIRLFANDNPLNENNHIYTPGEAGPTTAPGIFSRSPGATATAAIPPAGLLQLPYLLGTSWKFGGVHNTGGATVFTDASSLDFFPGGYAWGTDTSNMWVAASAAGTPTKISACYFKIVHSDGWETSYYHLENIQSYSGSIKQNDKIGVIANTLAEATCSGGAASGPHVHFSLKRNGAYVAIDGTPLSGWYVHSGRWSYDTDPAYMWLERSGIKKFANNNLLLSEAPPVSIFTISGNVGTSGATISYTDGTPKTSTSLADGSYSISVPSGWSGSLTASQPCITFSPGSLGFTSLASNQSAQNFSPSLSAGCGDINVSLSGTILDNFALQLKNSTTSIYPENNGPAVVESGGAPTLPSLGINYFEGNGTVRSGTPTSYSEIMGFPDNKLTNEYWFPWYNNVNMWSQLRLSNTSSTNPTTISVFLGTTLLGSYPLAPSASTRVDFPGVNGGPIRIVSSGNIPIIGAERIIYSQENGIYQNGLHTSYFELMGLPGNQITNRYWITWYDNTTMWTQLRFAN
ncbi:MAG: M23 family metallopeptidase, partial [Chloroflexi bacterium]|nr:M23 family metallopeptidase [Chloroflexota bacterium]